MKFAIATLVLAALAVPALAQAPAKSADAAAKPAAKRGKTPQEIRAQRRAAVQALTASQKQAIETLAPLEEPDPAIKLDDRDLEIAKRVHVGDIGCELGAKVEIKALRREGFFLVKHRLTRFVMHPVYSRTGAIRLEDPARGAVWLQLGNKSMLMNQKEGKRLADECQSPEQVDFAKNMKPVNLLEPAPAPAPAVAAASAAGGGQLPASDAAAQAAATPVAPQPELAAQPVPPTQSPVPVTENAAPR